MVKPSTGAAAPLQRIWDAVVEEKARLPGSWDTTLPGALDAARSEDWPLCAYLAASCFSDAGGAAEGRSALAALDTRCHRTLWLEVAMPVVIDVPLGHERLLVHLEGHEKAEWVSTSLLSEAAASDGKVWVQGRGRGVWIKEPKASRAEHFCPGALLELSRLQWRKTQRFQRLCPNAEELLKLQQVVCQDEACALPFLAPGLPRMHVPGHWFHVLAYPLAGDFTKALLRPAFRSWTHRQLDAAKGALQRLGETLMSACAKAGQWELVQVLCRAGVPCPDLTKEFGSICGSDPLVRSRWLGDLALVSKRFSLLQLCIEAPEPETLRSVLQALRVGAEEAGVEPAFHGLCGTLPHKPPLIAIAAMACSWDVVRILLDQPPGTQVSAAALQGCPAMARAPPDIAVAAEMRAKVEASASSGRRCKTLGEYLQRQHDGEVMGKDQLPSAYAVEDSTFTGPGGAWVLNWGFRLGTSSPSETASASSFSPPRRGVQGGRAIIAFVAVSRGEFAEARAAVANASLSLLPLDLSGRSVTLSDPPPGNTCWLAVLCPESFVMRKLGSGEPESLVVPANCIPTPQILRTVRIRILVTTPCCGAPLPALPVHVDGRRVGVSDHTGRLELTLMPGQYSIGSPTFCSAEVELVVKNGSGTVDVCLVTSGELVFFLLDNSVEAAGEVKDGLMLCGNRENIPDEGIPFLGVVTLAEDREAAPPQSPNAKRAAGPCVAPGKPCKEALKTLQVKSTDGREFKQSDDALAWFEEIKECQIALLFSSAQIRLGDLLGPRPAQGAAGARSLQRSAAETSVIPGTKSRTVGSPFRAPSAVVRTRSSTPDARRQVKAASATWLPRPAQTRISSWARSAGSVRWGTHPGILPQQPVRPKIAFASRASPKG